MTDAKKHRLLVSTLCKFVGDIRQGDSFFDLPDYPALLQPFHEAMRKLRVSPDHQILLPKV